MECKWMEGLEPMCVELWHHPAELEKQINAALPEGWKFLSHVIKEQDSFGPVTSLLTVKDANGNTYEGLI